jgi:hypothetical protein
VSIALYALAALLLVVAAAFGRKVRASRTLDEGAIWLALLGAACAGSMWAALFAGGQL